MMKVGKIVSLTHRRLQLEIMDQPGLDPARHWHALRGLARLNWLSGSAGILWPPIRELAREIKSGPLRILDVACGGGDVSIGLYRRAAQAALAIQIEAADISQNALTYARRQAETAHAPIHFFQVDALAEDFPKTYDVVFSSLFLHHLTDEQAVNLLRHIDSAARHMVLINDLARSRLGWTAAYVVTRMLTTSDVVHTDGPLSVEGAFTPEEALALAHQAGIHGATVARRWPFRFMLSWRRHE
jgi:2-polyprenyl-3-methyl-5-hydroxy-6-metoxy-1,4-benzoquinol methylase